MRDPKELVADEIRPYDPRRVPVPPMAVRVLLRIARHPGARIGKDVSHLTAWRLTRFRVPLAVIIDEKLYATPEGRAWLKVAGLLEAGC